MPKLVTEVADFTWNPSTGLFETLIFIRNTETGALEVADKFATPPRQFLLSYQRQTDAIALYRSAKRRDAVVAFPET